MALSERDQRTLKIGGIVLGVLIVGFLLLKVLGGGGGAEQGVGPPGVPGSLSPSPTPTTGPSGGPPVVLVFSGRDPFSPPPALVPSGSASPSGSPTSSPSPTLHAIVLPSTIVGGKILTLERTYVEGGVEKVDVQLDTRTVTGLEAGEDVGDGVRLESIVGRCATFSSADGSFTLCMNA